MVTYITCNMYDIAKMQWILIVTGANVSSRQPTSCFFLTEILLQNNPFNYTHRNCSAWAVVHAVPVICTFTESTDTHSDHHKL
jgi:hypothetical protein